MYALMTLRHLNLTSKCSGLRLKLQFEVLQVVPQIGTTWSKDVFSKPKIPFLKLRFSSTRSFHNGYLFSFHSDTYSSVGISACTQWNHTKWKIGKAETTRRRRAISSLLFLKNLGKFHGLH